MGTGCRREANMDLLEENGEDLTMGDGVRSERKQVMKGTLRWVAQEDRADTILVAECWLTWLAVAGSLAGLLPVEQLDTMVQTRSVFSRTDCWGNSLVHEFTA